MHGSGSRIQKQSRLSVADIPIDCCKISDGPEELWLYTVDDCGSSMDVAWALVEQERCHPWHSVLARQQSSGRGQFRRSWYSPPGNLYGALRLPSLGSVWDGLISLLLAESLFYLLDQLGLSTSVKWPNDVLVAGKKVGGVLIEVRAGIAVAGVGLNLIQAPQFSQLRNPLAPIAGCLREFGVQPSPLKFWLGFIRDLQVRLSRALDEDDPQQFVDRLTPHMAYLGERILVETNQATMQPVIFWGLDISGGIRVQTMQGKQIIHSGSIYPVL